MTEIAPDAPLTLDEAAALAFPGGTVTKRTLRGHRDRGELTTFRIGRLEYTTLNDIKAMIETCRAQVCRPASNGARKAATAPAAGTSTTAVERSAHIAAQAKIARLKTRSPNTSPAAAAARPARVIPLTS